MVGNKAAEDVTVYPLAQVLRPNRRNVIELSDKTRPLWGSPSLIPIARTPMLIPFLVGLFNRSFQPHLDQMQHRSVDDPSSHRLYTQRLK